MKLEMRKKTKRLVGGLVLAAGAIGAIGAVVMRKNNKAGRSGQPERDKSADTWARPGMKVIFRAELMPGRHTSERTFRVTDLLPSGRVLLEGVAGEHNEKEFQPIR